LKARIHPYPPIKYPLNVDLATNFHTLRNMKQFVDSIRSSVTTQNWFGALFMVLAVPDICAALENGLTSGPLYKSWYSRYLKSEYAPDPILSWQELMQHELDRFDMPTMKAMIRERYAATSPIDLAASVERANQSRIAVSFSADDCYKFRCKSLHQGIAEGFAGRVIEFSPPQVVSIHKCQVGDKYILDIRIFCMDMCNAVEQWLIDVNADTVIQQRISELMSLNSSVVRGIYQG